MSNVPRRPNSTAQNNNRLSKAADGGGAPPPPPAPGPPGPPPAPSGNNRPPPPPGPSTSGPPPPPSGVGSGKKGAPAAPPGPPEPPAAPTATTAPSAPVPPPGPSVPTGVTSSRPAEVQNPPAIPKDVPVVATPPSPPLSAAPVILTPEEPLLKPKADNRSTLVAMQMASTNPEEADTPMISITVSPDDSPKPATRKSLHESASVKSPPTIQIDDIVSGDTVPMIMDPPKPPALNVKAKETPKVEPPTSPLKSPINDSDTHRLVPNSKKAETTVHGSSNLKPKAAKGGLLAPKGLGASNLKGSVMMLAQTMATSMAEGVTRMFRGPSLYDFMNTEDRFGYKTEPKEIDYESSVRALYLLLDDDGNGTLSTKELDDLDLLRIDAKECSLADKIRTKLKALGKEEINYAELRLLLIEHYEQLKDKKSKKKFLDVLDDWKSLPNVFDLNLSLFFLLITFQFIIFAPVAYRAQVSLGNLIAGGAALALVLTGLFWAPVSFLHKIKQAVKRLYHANALATVTCFLGFLSAIATMYYYYLIFQANPLIAWYSELFLPWAVNLLCLVGIGCITFWTVSDESDSAMKRDARCLSSYTVKCPVDRHLEHAGQLLRLFVERASEKKVRTVWMKAAVLTMRYSKYVIPCLVIPVQSFLLDNSALAEYKKSNYDDYFKDRCTSTIDPWIMYWIGLILGMITTLISSISFESFLNRVSYRPFRRNSIMMNLLVASTDSIASCREDVPFLPLSKEENLTAFFKIANYLRTHEQGTQLGQAAAGFAGILLVDVLLIAGIVVNYYLMKPIEWRSMAIFVFYAAVATYWCFKILMEAVAINESHNTILERLLDYQGKVFMQASLAKQKSETDDDDKIDEDTANTHSRIANVRESIEQTYKPVTILGIPATKAMVELLGTYVTSAAAAVVGNQVASGISASPSSSGGTTSAGNGTV